MNSNFFQKAQIEQRNSPQNNFWVKQEFINQVWERIITAVDEMKKYEDTTIPVIASLAYAHASNNKDETDRRILQYFHKGYISPKEYKTIAKKVMDMPTKLAIETNKYIETDDMTEAEQLQILAAIHDS